GRREVADDGAAGGLGRAHAEAGEVGGDPEHFHADGEVGEDDHDDPADQHQGHGFDVADGVLQVAEAEGAQRGGNVHDEHQHDGLLAGEFHGFLRVDGGQRDHGLDAGLVEQDADEETAQVGVVARLAQGLHDALPRMLELAVRAGALLEEEEGRRGGEGEDHGGDDHHDGNELVAGLALFLSPGDVNERNAERNQAAQVAEGPAPARDAPHGL